MHQKAISCFPAAATIIFVSRVDIGIRSPIA
jgi:hypothetical protein